MIVISGALVLVALVLLVIGVVDPSLPFVYASIAVSLVSLVFLVIGILQRRGEPLPADGASDGSTTPVESSTEVGDGVTAVIPARSASAQEQDAPTAEQPAVVEEEVDEELETGGTVLVVSGRPRYHAEGCRYLTGKDAEPIDVLDAREDGFTPCGVCKPDEALTGALEEPSAFEAVEEPVAVEPVAVEPEPEVVEEPPARPARRAAAKKASSVRAPKAETQAVPDPLEEVAAGRGAKPVKTAAGRAAKAAPAAAPAEQAPARTATAAPVTKPAKTPAKGAAKTAPVKSAPAKTGATGATGKAAVKAAPVEPTAPAARRTGTVVVIPERGRFHRSDCRYVRDVDGAEVLTKAQASKQGFEACGVCKP